MPVALDAGEEAEELVPLTVELRPTASQQNKASPKIDLHIVFNKYI